MSRFQEGQKGIASLLALWISVGGLFVVWAGAQMATDRVREGWQDAYPLLFLPNGRYLAAASLGFRVLLADTIYLWSIQYYGHRRTVEGRTYLRHIYDTITDLDPQFIDAYLLGALVMASDMSDPEMAIELIDKGIGNNPDNWLLPLEAGWYSYMNLERYDQAERYYQQAMAIPGAPPWAARLRAHMIAQQGNLLAAVQEWEAIRRDAEAAGDPQTAAFAEQHVYDLSGQYVIEEIENAIGRFQEAEGRLPESLVVLVQTGLLTTVPVNARYEPVNLNNEPLRYDPATGEVTDPSAERARTQR